MRIALVHRAWSTLGGTERYLVGLTRGLVSRGHHVEVLCARWDPSIPLPPGAVGHRIPWIRPTAALKAWSFDLGVRRALRERVREAGPFHIVESLCRTTQQDVWRAGGGAWAEWVAARGPAGLGFTDRLFAAIEGRSCRATPRVIAVSHLTGAALRARHHLPEERVRVLHNPVDADRFSPAVARHRGEVRRALGIPQGARVALTVGTGFARKGLSALLQAAAGVGGAPVHVVAAGADGGGWRYRRLARELGIPLHLTGPRKDVERLYGAADAFALATRYDPCSNATLEAAACGLPVVTTPANGAAEILPEEARLLAGPEDVPALTRALDAALVPGARASRGAALARAARDHGWGRHLDEVEALYGEVLAERGRIGAPAISGHPALISQA